MIIDTKYAIGQTVYLKTDPDQAEKIITGINIRQTGLSYELSFGHTSSWHYDFEITEEKDVVKKCDN